MVYHVMIRFIRDNNIPLVTVMSTGNAVADLARAINRANTNWHAFGNGLIVHLEEV